VGEVEVLELVHEHVGEAPVEPREAERAQDEVARVERALLGEQAVVVGVQPGELALALAALALDPLPPTPRGRRR
jgi:hypothetical protein